MCRRNVTEYDRQNAAIGVVVVGEIQGGLPLSMWCCRVRYASHMPISEYPRINAVSFKLV